MEKVLKLKNLKKYYGQTRAVEDVSFCLLYTSRCV